ncbi:hypothetical protein OHA40_21945 [Nocardia sp. NBC_00508]|uniref:hypothetical protein n=1 Tax=Nocardia sp. NBC_00508 TaxID=2975992 RepID=UPI002E8128AD|nr:hypothetical protein [Nocardia sp. NBC_00508]WUD64355.1 hypothetical protein OHA40_21945 [Nocardia sp. NBC_00508]
MEERVAGKIFGVQTGPVDPELLAEANAAFEEFNARPPQVHPRDLPARFRDDYVGTEKEALFREQEAQRQREWAEQRQQEHDERP